MDGLPIPESNPHLPYKSQTAFAHMCGHDGHTTTLLATAFCLQQSLHKIPKSQKIRLLFQPAEEGPGGAQPMVEEGCLEGVDEVYGFHNIPNFEEGDIRVCEGPIFAQSTIVRIKVKGQGGHGSAPHKLHDPINAATAIHLALHSIKSRAVDSRSNIVFSICHIESGHTFNVFPDEAFLEGTIRSYDEPTFSLMKSQIT
jgi:amidohydrolase